MEPDIIPLHSSSPPPLDDDNDEDDDDGEVGSHEDEFGDFGGFSAVVSCSPLSFANSAEPPSSLRQPSPKPATYQPYYSFNQPVEQLQPASSVQSQTDVEGQGCNAGPSLHLANGYAEREHTSATYYTASVEGVCSPKEETGFADFTVFTDQAAHPWCCGLSPVDSAEQWDGRVEGINLTDKICDPGQEIIMNSEPRSHCAHKTKVNVCTKVKHCENIDPALEEPSQDHHQPQDAAAALDFSFYNWRESGRSLACNSLETPEAQKDVESEEYREDREKSISNVPQTFSVYESPSEDPGSFCEDFSFEGVSADLEPNVSSLTSQEDQTDLDKTDDEGEDQGNYRDSDSFVNDSIANLRQSEAEKGFHHCNQSATQETPATSNVCGVQSPSGKYTENEISNFNHSSFEHQRDQEHVQRADVRVQSLPPSDSFADFCSAPLQEDGDGAWAKFNDQKPQEESKTWTQFREQVSSLHIDGDTEEEEEDRAGQYGLLRRNSCQDSLACRVQQLLQGSFPEIVVPATDSEEELLSLDDLLHTQPLPETEEEKTELSSTQWTQQGLWWPQQDIHSAVGLRFQWGGSHTNRTLLRCLGVDTRNIVFIGMKKQPVTVPAFASGLGLLEPTKDFVPAVHSPRHTAVTAPTPPGPRDEPDPSVQAALPSSQLDWSSRGLSSSQDGVDPDLYELTNIKLETSANSSQLEDALNQLMSSAVKSGTSSRKPPQDDELSAEAGRVIDALPDLSFMKARFLMFPSLLVSRECSAE
ncbi:aftiphilin isoform X2 [Anabas testudineus]|uniref:aftiphilin isoform X2 n=1 Tax=Anabas testudineus TaxID=64144 RepID=UPI000E4630D1|nr:aftiphilin isoform X2 [Anabas testudineus]